MIKVLKLTTGEELVGDVNFIENMVEVKKPCALIQVPSRTNPEQVAMALIPYAQYAKDHTVLVSVSHVIWSQEPVKELYNQYNTVFGTGLVVPT